MCLLGKWYYIHVQTSSLFPWKIDTTYMFILFVCATSNKSNASSIAISFPRALILLYMLESQMSKCDPSSTPFLHHSSVVSATFLTCLKALFKLVDLILLLPLLLIKYLKERDDIWNNRRHVNQGHSVSIFEKVCLGVL